VAKSDLGTKRICPTTGKKFYDLNKTPVISPYTGEVVPIAPVTPPRMARGDAARASAAAAAAALLAAVTVLIWGLDPWRGFFQASPLARIALEQNLVGNEKMQSLFAAVSAITCWLRAPAPWSSVAPTWRFRAKRGRFFPPWPRAAPIRFRSNARICAC